MKHILKKKYLLVFLHLVFWIAIWSVPLLFVAQTPDDEETWLVMIPIMTGLFYLNTKVLYPYLWPKKQYIRYLFILLSAGLLASFIYNTVQLYLGKESNAGFLGSVMVEWFVAIAFISIGTVERIVSTQIRQQRELHEKENEKLRTELSFLRSQVSPHFMFNVLNTLVALIRQKSEDLEPAVMKLSSLLRYMIYESDHEKVSVNTEVEYLKSYIDLQLLRFGDVVKTHFLIQESLATQPIEPMLLIPLVENAFKHGMNVAGQPEITVNLMMDGQRLRLFVYNKTHPKNQNRPQSESGIGLTNLKRRLELLYPGKHRLELCEKNNTYNATLEIELNDELPDY